MDNLKRPEFLTNELENLFPKIGDALNVQLMQEKKDKAHLIEHMSNQMKSGVRRAWLGGIIGDYVSAVEGLYLKHTYNMCGIVINKEWFARIIKIIALDEDNPPEYPKSILRAIRKALQEDYDNSEAQTQLSLTGFENETQPNSLRIEVASLRQGIIGYIVDHNDLVAGFVFAEYVENSFKLQNIYRLDLNSGNQSTTQVPSPEFDPSDSSTTFTIKPAYKKIRPREDEA